MRTPICSTNSEPAGGGEKGGRRGGEGGIRGSVSTSLRVVVTFDHFDLKFVKCCLLV